MDIKKAKKIVSALADGIDPITGEILPTDHLCNNPDIVRAFYTLLHMNNKSNNISAQNAGKPWTLEDDNELRNMYEKGASKKELQEYFARTSGSIQSRLVKLGLIEDKRK